MIFMFDIGGTHVRARGTEALQRLLHWSEVYSRDVFPEPDWEKACELLKAGSVSSRRGRRAEVLSPIIIDPAKAAVRQCLRLFIVLALLSSPTPGRGFLPAGAFGGDTNRKLGIDSGRDTSFLALGVGLFPVSDWCSD